MSDIAYPESPRFDPYSEPHAIEEPLVEPRMAGDWLLASGRAVEGADGDLQIDFADPLSCAAHALHKIGAPMRFSEVYSAVVDAKDRFISDKVLAEFGKTLVNRFTEPTSPA